MITIKTTEHFEIRNQDDIITKGEKPRKIWLLFKILLVHYDQPLHYEQIYEYLSGEVSKDIKSMVKNLVYRLRKELMKLELYHDDYLNIIYANESYTLKVGRQVRFDLKKINEMQHREKQDLKYGCLFHNYPMLLPEERFSEWLFPIRHYYEKTHLKQLILVLTSLEKQHRYDECVNLSEFAVELYPDDETISAYLIKSYMHQGNRAKAIKYYYELEDRLYEEFGVEPSDQIQKIMKQVNETSITNGSNDLALNGALVCNINQFQMIHQLEKRKALRENNKTRYIHIKISSHNLEQKRKIKAISLMILKSLRQSDVFSEEEEGSYHVLLQDVEDKEIPYIESRIVNHVESMMDTNQIKYEVKLIQ
ncbi:MAG: hypothetical protein JXR88_09610 [Clostridia bacterium]|nr:hypothetical protein [Clostridia bacterium]